jgi:hypothetical protein
VIEIKGIEDGVNLSGRKENEDQSERYFCGVFVVTLEIRTVKSQLVFTLVP